MEKSTVVKGYKIFHEDFTCYGGFQYKVGKTYTMDADPVCCKKGFHFCTVLARCFQDYDFNPKNRVAEVEAFGKIDILKGKYCTNGIRIIRELSWHEVLDLVNTGNNCTGFGNSGCYNSGDWNSGWYNRGSHNSGDSNKGDTNSGNYNKGNLNTGSGNTGDMNTGYRNTGDKNTGNQNMGIWNAGNRNTGNNNTGNNNSGDKNTGNRNTGNQNCGEGNTGDGNTGDWNITSGSTGCFNTMEQQIYMFNKMSGMTLKEWKASKARAILSRAPKNTVKWVALNEMTDEEKWKHPEHETTHGYLKAPDESDSVTLWWNNLSEEDKNIIKALPNFDWDIFCQCVGIDKENANP